MKSKNGFAVACKNVISDIEIKKVRRKVSDEQETDEPIKSIYGIQEEMMAGAGLRLKIKNLTTLELSGKGSLKEG